MTRKPGTLLGLLWCVPVATLLLAAWCEVASAAASGNPQGRVRLVINKVVPGQIVTDHDWGLVRLEIGVEAQKKPVLRKGVKSRRTQVEVRVDGLEVGYQLLDSRAGYEGKRAFSYRTLGLPLGDPGPHSLNVTLGQQSRTIPVVFAPAGQLEISGLCDEQAVFGKKEFELRWFGCYLAPKGIRATVNDREVPVEVTWTDDRLHLLEGRLRPIGKIGPGRNTVTLEGIDVRGGKQKRSVSFRYYPENRVTVGDVFVLNVGTQEPTGRPFFEVKVDGKSITKGEYLSVRPCPERLGGETVLSTGKTLLARFEAVAPGEATIRMTEKQRRTDLPRETGSFRVLVQTRGQARSVEKARTSGFALEWIEVPGLFGCLVPEDWTLTRNPDGDRNIFGISAYRQGQGDTGGTGPKLMVEFYPPDNEAGFSTVEDFVTAMSGQGRNDRSEPSATVRDFDFASRQGKRFERNVKLAAKTLFFFARPIPVVEEYAVVPGRDGFYVLSFRAHREESREALALFDAMIGSFEPLR